MRVVSLVPSITEALASVRPEAIVGATDWCTHPADLDQNGVARVRGTKNPDLAAIRGLAPDLVIANKEENRELDVRRLRNSGIRVHVTDIKTVPEAIQTYQQLFDDILAWPRPDWLAHAESLWCLPAPTVTRRVAVAIWRDPWMVVGSRTFTGDLLRHLGWENVYSTDESRYPRVQVDDLDNAGADAILLPDEPYIFTADDGPEAFTTTPIELVSGRLLTWYGPSLVEAYQRLAASAGLRPWRRSGPPA
jgi:ABC-type Fe3+-hydroxamate transport system substrate-binding protein